MSHSHVTVGLKRNLKNRHIYKSEILKWMNKWHKTGFLHYKGGKSIEPLPNRIYLPVCRQEFFCSAISYLQLSVVK